MRKFIIVLVVIISTTYIYSQEINTQHYAPAAPDVEAMKEYIDMEVNEHTGTPGISIPLESISDNGISMQVSIRYHANGHKVSEEASMVGLGWSLSAGGMITREIRDKDDLNFRDGFDVIQDGYLTKIFTDANYGSTLPQGSTVFGPQNDLETVNENVTIKLQSNGANSTYIANNGEQLLYADHFCEPHKLDTESDIYNYSFGNYSGKFILKWDGTFVTLSDHNLDISYDINLKSWTIITPDGNTYFFGKTEATRQKSYSNSFSFSSEVLGGDLSCPQCAGSPLETVSISTWYLNSGESKSGGALYFQYDKCFNCEQPIPTFSEKYIEVTEKCRILTECNPQSWFEGFLGLGNGYVSPDPVLQYHASVSRYSFDRVLLSSITNSRGESLQFSYDVSTRKDLIGGAKLLSIAKGYVQNDIFSLKRKFDFSYSYFTSYLTENSNQWQNKIGIWPGTLVWRDRIKQDLNNNGLRLKLDRITQKSSTGLELPPFKFIYNIKSLPPKTSYSVDYWGFANGKDNNTFYLHRGKYQSNGFDDYIMSLFNFEVCSINCTNRCRLIDLPFSNKNSDLESVKSNILEEIVFPTGAKTSYDYEMNSFNPIAPKNGFDKIMGEVSSIDYIVSSNNVDEMGIYNIDDGYVVFEKIACDDVEIRVHGLITPESQCYGNPQIKNTTVEFRDLNNLTGEPYVVDIIGVLEADGTFDINKSAEIPEGSYLVTFYDKVFQCIRENSGGSFQRITVENYKLSYGEIASGAGLRIQKKSTCDEVGNVLNSSYAYEGGKLYSYPSFFENKFRASLQTNGITLEISELIEISSNSINPMFNSYASSLVGYSTVTKELHKGTNCIFPINQDFYGEIVSTYINNVSDVDDDVKFLPLALPFFVSQGNGLLLNRKTYSGQNVKVQEIQNNYRDSWLESNLVWNTRMRVAGSNVGTLCLPLDPIIHTSYYAFLPQWHRLDNTISKTWGTDGGGFVEATKTYTYYDDNYSVATETTTDGVTSKVVEYKYAHNLGVQFMIDANMISTPLEMIVNDGIGGGSKMTYTTHGDYILPHTSLTIGLDNSLSKEAIKLYYDDSDPFPDKIKKRSNTNLESLIWGNGLKDGLVEDKTYGSRLWDYTYDNYRQLESITDYNGITSSFLYDGLMRLRTSMSNNGKISTGYTYTYGLATGGENNVISNTTYTDGAPALLSTSVMDGFGRSTNQTIAAYLDDNSDLVTSQVYDPLGSVISATDPSTGGTTTYEYEQSPLHRLLTTTPAGSPRDITTSYSSESNQYVVTTTDENGISTKVYTDIFGRTTKTVDGMGMASSYTYNDRDQVLTIQPPAGAMYVYTYYNDGLLHTKTIPDKGTHTYTYTDQDQIHIETLPNGKKVEYVYDDIYNDFLRAVKLADNTIKTYIPYDDKVDWVGMEKQDVFHNGGVINDGYTVQYMNYDPDFGRPQSERVTTLDGVVVNDYTYDDAGNAKIVTSDVNGPGGAFSTSQTGTFLPANRLTEMTATYGGFNVSYDLTFDEHDWLTQRSLADDIQVIDYKYNPRGWLTHINTVTDVIDDTDPCEKVIPEGPIPEIDCDDKIKIINQILLDYNCDQLNGGGPTVLSLTINSHYLEDQSIIGSDVNTYEISINGGTSGSELSDQLTFSFDNPIEPETFPTGLAKTLIDCIGNNPDLLEIIKNAIAEALAGTGPAPQDPTDEGGTPAAPTNSNADIFGLQLHYYDGNSELGGEPQFNGNISWAEWSVKSEKNHAYGFDYDNNNRLRRAFYGTEQSSNPCEYTIKDDYKIPYIGYDPMGNITRLYRFGLLNPEEDMPTYGLIDGLHYTYASGSSKLTNVSDTQNPERGFMSVGSAYGYDGTGNLISDSGKEITDIKYTYNDLPLLINTEKGYVKNWYTADGQKVKSTTVSTEEGPDGMVSAPVTYNYVGSGEFVNGKLQSIYFDDGRIAYYKGEAYREFYLKDHLGNTRARIADKNNDAKVSINPQKPDKDELMDVMHYYPFGMQWDTPLIDKLGNSLKPTGQKTKYTYNGKEFQDDLGINLQYYGYRMYDPAIGRFASVDPIAERFAFVSGFNYAENNPISNIDLHGLQAVLATDGKLLGYKVQAGQGPTQIAKDINDNHPSSVNGKVSFTNIVYNNPDKFNNVIKGKAFDKNNPDFKSGNISEGDMLLVSNGFQDAGKVVDNIEKIDKLVNESDSMQEVSDALGQKIELSIKIGEYSGAPTDPKTGASTSALIKNTIREVSKRSTDKKIEKNNQTIDSIKNVNDKLQDK